MSTSPNPLLTSQPWTVTEPSRPIVDGKYISPQTGEILTVPPGPGPRGVPITRSGPPSLDIFWINLQGSPYHPAHTPTDATPSSSAVKHDGQHGAQGSYPDPHPLLHIRDTFLYDMTTFTIRLGKLLALYGGGQTREDGCDNSHNDNDDDDRDDGGSGINSSSSSSSKGRQRQERERVEGRRKDITLHSVNATTYSVTVAMFTSLGSREFMHALQAVGLKESVKSLRKKGWLDGLEGLEGLSGELEAREGVRMQGGRGDGDGDGHNEREGVAGEFIGPGMVRR